MAMFAVTGTLAVILTFMLAGVIADFFNVDPLERVSFIRLVWIIGVTTGFSFIGSVLTGIVTAREHYVANNILVVFQELLRAGLTVLFINLGWGLLGVGLAPLISEACGTICSFALFRMFDCPTNLYPIKNV